MPAPALAQSVYAGYTADDGPLASFDRIYTLKTVPPRVCLTRLEPPSTMNFELFQQLSGSSPASSGRSA